MDVQRATMAAVRCFYVARSYLAAGKAVEAAGLFQRTTERVSQAEEAWDDLEHPDTAALEDLEALKEQAVVTHCTPSYHTDAIRMSACMGDQGKQLVFHTRCLDLESGPALCAVSVC